MHTFQCFVVACSDRSHLLVARMGNQVHMWRARASLDPPAITAASDPCRPSSGESTSAFSTFQFQTSFLGCCLLWKKKQKTEDSNHVTASGSPICLLCQCWWLPSSFRLSFHPPWTISRVSYLAFLALVGLLPTASSTLSRCWSSLN